MNKNLSVNAFVFHCETKLRNSLVSMIEGKLSSHTSETYAISLSENLSRSQNRLPTFASLL